MGKMHVDHALAKTVDIILGDVFGQGELVFVSCSKGDKLSTKAVSRGVLTNDAACMRKMP